MRLVPAIAAALALAGCSTVVWKGRSSDRAHRIEVVERLGRQRVVVDGVAGPAYAGVGVSGLTVDAGGDAVYAARRGDGWRVVRGGREGEAWDGIAELVLSADGTHLAYAAERGGVWRVLVDGHAGPEFAAILAGSLRVGSNGRVAYAAERDGRSFAVAGERVGPPRDGIAPVTLTDDGEHVAWLARRDGAALAVVDGVAGPAWDEVRDLSLGPSGDAAYAARRGTGWFAVIGGLPRGPHADVTRVQVAPGGSAVYAAREGDGERVVAGANTGAPLDAVFEIAVGDGDGDRVGYAGWRGDEAVVVVDGVERGRWRTSRGFTLGPRGRWAVVVGDDGGTLVVHDAGEERVAQPLADTLAFAGDGRWGVVAVDATSGRMRVAVEGGGRVALDAEDLAAAAQREQSSPAGLGALLRAWVAAEVARAPR